MENDRPGLYLWVNRDGSGKDWQKINVLANHNKFLPDEPITLKDADLYSIRFWK